MGQLIAGNYPGFDTADSVAEFSVVAAVLGYRKKTELLAVVAINLITNPVSNALEVFIHISFIELLVLEVFIVLWEWRMLVWTLDIDSKKLLTLSIVANLSSFVVGSLLFSVISNHH